MQILKGKRALVTGASTGIGRSIAWLFADNGCSVAVGYYRSRDQAASLVEEIERNGGRAVLAPGDVSKEADANRVVAQAAEALGGLDILVNNAGSLVQRGLIGDMATELWHEVVSVNLNSVFYCTRAAIPHLRRAGGGRIINMGSISGQNGGGGGSVHYAAAKGGVHAFTRGLGRELAADGITVNCIAPGVIDTLFHERFTSRERWEQMMEQIPVHRAGRPDEVAWVALFLASEHAAYVNGQVIPVNGGQLTA